MYHQRYLIISPTLNRFPTIVSAVLYGCWISVMCSAALPLMGQMTGFPNTPCAIPATGASFSGEFDEPQNFPPASISALSQNPALSGLISVFSGIFMPKGKEDQKSDSAKSTSEKEAVLNLESAPHEYYYDLGMEQLSEGNLKDAEQAFRICLSKALMSEDASYSRSALLQLAEIFANQGDPETAYIYLMNYANFTDSLLRRAQDKQGSISAVKTANEKIKQKQLEKEQKIWELSRRNLKQRENQLYLFGGVMFAMILAGMLLFLLRQRHQAALRLRAQNEEISAALRLRDALLGEIHHRVKNNLQVIMSLLNLQTSYIQSDSAYEAVKEGRNRIKTMAIIHQRLYQHKELNNIDIRGYIQDLVVHLQDSYKTDGQSIEVDLAVDQLFMDVDQAIYLGLFVNEVVTNAFKYAFLSRGSGEIRISFTKGMNGEYKLEVADNGVGLPIDVDWRNPESYGLKLITVFAAELGGELDIWNDHGTRVTLNFKVKAERKIPELWNA